MKTIRFGIIGCGLMGREFASAAARWCHLSDVDVRPEIVAICDQNPQCFDWFTEHFDTIRVATTDYAELLERRDIDAVYCAVPHHLHERVYCDVIDAGKHLFGEKPFGIDRKANDAIRAHAAKHPEVFVRCCSQFLFYPGVQHLAAMMESDAFGTVLEAEAGFLHSSDLNPDKPINWKRMVKQNGEYGCMGDLGMHVCLFPFRAGWRPKNVRAILSNIVTERPDGRGGRAPCDTWDNATLFCETENAQGTRFPLILKTQRIAPGETNTWYIEIKGTRACARFSTRDAQMIRYLEYKDGRQDWAERVVGYTTAFPTITGSIFEFGFPDAILQMWAGFLHELVHGQPRAKFAGVATLDEAALSHRLFTAALESQKNAATMTVEEDDA